MKLRSIPHLLHRRAMLGFLLPVVTLLLPAPSVADSFPSVIRTDVNIATALDVSDSIGRHEEWLQQTGLVRALVHPAFLGAATAGLNLRIGFAAFTWSSDGEFRLVIPWTIIASLEDAARVSSALATITLIDRSYYGGGDLDEGDRDHMSAPDRRTDMSAAVDYASLLLMSAPYVADRSVMNVCANGVDNVEGGTELSRDRALAQGFTVNGLVLGGDAEVTQYFRSSVIGGFGSFVMGLSDPNHAGEIMARKLTRDIVAARQQ